MKIKYLGPNDRVNVEPYGDHYRDRIKGYPDDFGEELLATSVKQQFEVVEGGDENELEAKTVPELTAMLEEKGIEIPKKARKAELIEMVKAGLDREPAPAD